MKCVCVISSMMTSRCGSCVCEFVLQMTRSQELSQELKIVVGSARKFQ